MQLIRKGTPPLQIIALLLVFTVSFFIGKFIADWGMLEKPDTPRAAAAEKEAILPVERLNVLLLGIDARPGEKDARTDSIILVSIDRETKKMAMVSIPRDTLVDIPGYGQNKINAANVYGGADLARETVENLLGVEIPYYVKTNFEGFKEIVDTLGGVEIEVEKPMRYAPEKINLKPGLQKLDGKRALDYVRFRHDALGDIGRTERQQKFLTALAKEMLKARTLIKAPVLIPKLMDAVETNLGVKDALFLAKVVSKLDSENIVTATLPGVFYNYKGASYWKIDEAKARVVLNDLFNGIKVATITGPDINVPKDKPQEKKTEQPVTPPAESRPAEENSGLPADVEVNPVEGEDKNGAVQPVPGEQPGNSDNTGGTPTPGTGTSPPGQQGPDQGQSPPVTQQPGQGQSGQNPGSGQGSQGSQGGQGGHGGQVPPGTTTPAPPVIPENPTTTGMDIDIITQG